MSSLAARHCPSPTHFPSLYGHFLGVMIAFLLASFAAPSAWAASDPVTRYAVTLPAYTHLLSSENVGAGAFSAYLDDTKSLSGWFETTEPLAANLADADSVEIVAYALNDGSFTYTETNSAILLSAISTDENGVLTKAELVIVSPSAAISPIAASDGAFTGTVRAMHVTSSGYLTGSITDLLMSKVGVTSLPTGIAILNGGNEGEQSKINAFSARADAVCDVDGESNQTCTFSNKGTAYVANLDSGISWGIATVPGAPIAVSATAGNAQATVSWTAPAMTGGLAITGYTVTGDPAGSCSATAPETTCTVTGLTNGQAYIFTVLATNSEGNSAASTASDAVTPTASPQHLAHRWRQR